MAAGSLSAARGDDQQAETAAQVGRRPSAGGHPGLAPVAPRPASHRSARSQAGGIANCWRRVAAACCLPPAGRPARSTWLGRAALSSARRTTASTGCSSRSMQGVAVGWFRQRHAAGAEGFWRSNARPPPTGAGRSMAFHSVELLMLALAGRTRRYCFRRRTFHSSAAGFQPAGSSSTRIWLVAATQGCRAARAATISSGGRSGAGAAAGCDRINRSRAGFALQFHAWRSMTRVISKRYWRAAVRA